MRGTLFRENLAIGQECPHAGHIGQQIAVFRPAMVLHEGNDGIIGSG
jgi:hypothetical protein